MSKKFDSSAIFNVLPSFWREYYKDKPVITALYDAVLRLQESDYSRLFHIDDAKSIASVPITTAYPVVYEELNQWEKAFPGHAHFISQQVFSPVAQRYLGETGPLYYKVVITGHLFREQPQLYLNGRFVPGFLYIRSTEPVISGSHTLRGTTIYIDAEKLATFIQSQQALLQHWPEIEELDTVTVYSFDDTVPFYTDLTGLETEIAFPSLGGAQAVPELSSVILESAEITNRVKTIYHGTYSSIIPLGNKRFVPGQVVRVLLDNSTVQDIVALAEDQIIVQSTLTVVEVHEVFNFTIAPSALKISTTDISLTTGRFPVGGVFRVTDNKGSFTVTARSPVSRITLPRNIDTATATVALFNINLAKVQVLKDKVVLGNKAVAGVRLRVEAALTREHVHEKYSVVLAANATNITLPYTPPAGHTLRLYADGILLDTSDYTRINNVVSFSELPAGTRLTAFLTHAPEEVTAHTHLRQEFAVPVGAQTTSSLLMREKISAAPELFIDSGLYNDATITTVADQNLVLPFPLNPGNFVTVFAERSGRPFKHVLPERADSAYDYKGRIVDITTIQDGLVSVKTVLTKGQEFDLVEENGLTCLYSDTAIEKAWFFNVAVDERSLSKVWGTLFDIDEPSSDSSYRRISALVAAARSHSLVDNIVNLGSIVLGSAYLEESGTSLGVIKEGDQSVVSVRPADTESTEFTVPLIPGAAVRVRDGEQLPRLHAVNALVELSDKDLSGIKWLPVFAETLSTDFRIADRFDAGKPHKVISRPTSFDTATRILTDYSVDFVDAEIRPNDLIKIEFSPVDVAGSLAEEPTKLIHVTRVLGPHQLLLEELNVDETVTGWGDLAFGAGTYGGGVFRPLIWRYTVWSRTTRRLDSFTGLDTIPSDGKALVSAEDLTWLATRLSSVLKHHLFTLKLDWHQVKDVAALNDLRRLLGLIKPAETAAIVFTEYNNTAGITDSFGGTLTEASPSLSVAGNPVIDTVVVGESFISGDYVPNNSGIAQLYAPQNFSYGPEAFALTYGPDTQPAANRLYLTTDRSTMLLRGSTWADLYSSNHGLANLLLKSTYTSPFYTYSVYNAFGNRDNGRAVVLTQDRKLTGTLSSSPAFTFRTWIRIPTTHSMSPGMSPVVFKTQSGPQALLDVLSPNGFKFGIRRSPLAPAHYASPTIVPGTDTFLAASVGLSGASTLYVNNIQSTRALGTGTSFSGAFQLGESTSTTQGLDAILDETVFVSYAASPAIIAAWYNGGNGVWSSPLGVGQGALAENRAELVLHYDLENVFGSVMYDHSGKGRDLYKTSSVDGDVATDWTTAGIVSTPLPSEGDFYNISREGYHVSEGIAVSAGPLFSLPNSEGDLAPATFYAIDRGDRVFYDPNVAYAYAASGGWTRRSYFANSVGSSIGAASQNEYTGFVAGSRTAPDGTTTLSPMSANIVIGIDPTVTLSARNNGAISAVTTSSYNYLYADTKAHLLQNKWDAVGAYTLCETGFAYESPGASPKSRLISFSSNSHEAATSVYTAFSSPRTVGAFLLEASGDRLSKRVKAGAFNNPHIIELDSAFDFYVSKINQNAAWVHSFAVQSPFTVAHTFFVGAGDRNTSAPVTLSAPEDGRLHHLNTTFKGGVILSNVDRSLAIGLYHNGPSKSSHRIITDIVYETSPHAHVLFINREHNEERGGYAQGTHIKSRYLCVGSFADVSSAFVQLYNTLNNLNVTPPSGAVSIDAQPWSISNQARNSPFTVTVTALNNIGAVDTSWPVVVTASLIQGDGLQGVLTRSPVSGVATFPNLSFSTYGNKTIQFSSGTLVDTVDVVVPYPTPVITRLSPTTAAINYGTRTVAIYGSGFLSPSQVSISGIPAQPASVTYVSPGKLTVALPLVPPAGLRRITVTNPTPGGGTSNFGGFFVSNPAPIILSPHYLELTSYPLFWNAGQAEFVTVTAYQSPSGAIATASDGLFKVNVYTSINQYVGTFSAPPVSGIATVQPVITTAGTYRLDATHSPATLGPARATQLSQFITVYGPDPLVSRVSPSWFAPSATAAPLINVFGNNFTAASEILFNNSNKPTNFVSPGHVQAFLNVGDIAVQGVYPVQVRVPTAANPLSNAVNITVSPLYVPPAVVSPHALTLSVASGPFNAGAAIPFSSTVVGVSGQLATYAAGRFSLVLSPITDPLYPAFTGTLTYSAPTVFTNSQLVGSFSVSSFGQYRLTAKYSPASGEPAVSSATRSFTTLVGAPIVQRASPATYSPAGTQTVSLIGTGFTNTASVLYYTLPNAADAATRTTTFVNSNRITFGLSPSDYPAAGTRVAYAVVTQPYSSGNSGVQFISLVKPASTSPWYLSFSSDPTNPNATSQVPTTLRVGGGWLSGPQQVTVNAFTKEDVVATTATGAAVLTTSPQTPEFTGTVLLRQPFVQGQAVFPAASLAISRYGAYVFKATHSPAGGVGYIMSPTELSSVVNVLNYVPSVTSVTPSSVNSGVGSVIVSIKGDHFLQNSPRGMTITVGSTVRDFTYLSPKEVLLTLQPADTTNAGTLYASLTNYYSAAVPPYQAATATVNVVGDAYNANEESLPATIEVSPAGWRRRLPTLGVWTTFSAPPGSFSDSLREAIRRSYPAVQQPTPVIPVSNGLGATEVIEVSAGAYTGWDFSAGNQAKQIGMHTGVSRQQPYIIRAKKRPQGSLSEFEPVVIGYPNTQSSLTADTGTTLFASVSGPAGINRPSYMTFLGIRVLCGGQDGLNWGDASNANGPVDYLYRDIKWVKCAFLGRWDYRTISLTPRRHTRSMTAATLTTQQQWNHLGALIVPPVLSSGDSPLYSMNINISEALACFSSGLPGYLPQQSPVAANSMLVSAKVDQPISLKGVILGIPPTGRRPVTDPTGTVNRYLNPDIATTGAAPNDYKVVVRVVAPTGGAIASCVWGGGSNSPSNDVFANVEQAQGLTPEILSTNANWVSLRNLPAGEFTRGIRYLANSAPNRPASGDLYGGVWAYQNVRFKKPGRYAFEAIVTRNGSQVPGSLPQYFFVNVTSGGVSQPDTRWEVMARNPVIPYLTTVNRSLPFSIPVLVSLLEDFTPPTGHGTGGSIDQRIPSTGITSQTNHGVSGITDAFMVTISSPDYDQRKWRWAYQDGTTYSPNVSGIGKYGFATNMVDGFITPLIPTTPAATAYGSLLLKCLSPLPGRQSVTLNIRIRPGFSPSIRPGAYNFKATAPLSVVVEMSPTASAVGVATAPLLLPTTTGTRGNSSLKAYTVEGGTKLGNATFTSRIGSFDGRYFAPGWPGDPNHLNFDPELRRWWPSPAKNLTYSEHGYTTKWGMQVYTHEGFDFLSSAVLHMYKEHNIYTHNCYGINISDSVFKYAGRLNLQFTWRRWDNYPQPFDTTGGRSGWITGNNRFNYSSIGYDLVIRNNRFADSGLNDGNVHIGITEHGGNTYIENNVHRNGFNSELRHVFGGGGSSGSAFIVIYSGSAFKPTGNKQDMSFYFPYMTDAAGPVLNPADLNQYTRLLPIGSFTGLYQHFSPGHPAYYIFTLTRQMVLGGPSDQNCIAYRDGTTWPQSQIDLNHPTHPYRNRAYGHPSWSTSGKTDYIEVFPPWAQSDPQYPGGRVRLGAPQTNYPGAHQLGDVYLKNNIMWTNVYGAGTVDEVSAADTPNAQVRAAWVTPGQIPVGLRQGTGFLTGTAPGAGTRTGVFIGGPRAIYLQENDIRHAPRPALRLSSVTSTSESSDPPALNVSGYGNNFVGGRDYFDNGPNSAGTFGQQVSFSLFRALLSPNPGPPGQLF